MLSFEENHVNNSVLNLQLQHLLRVAVITCAGGTVHPKFTLIYKQNKIKKVTFLDINLQMEVVVWLGALLLGS